MKNILAIKLAEAAEKYRNRGTEISDAADVIKSDYEDLMSIAGMIENNESPQSIKKAMWSLDTAVRDVIPDKVYYMYNE